MPIVEQFVTSVDGTKIYAESAGDRSKPTIVFSHGLAGTVLAWDSQFSDPDLRRDFHLVRYDLRGHGRSDKPVGEQAYESIKFAEDFKAVCDGFGVEKPFFAGWSLGGCVVVDIVAAYGPTSLSGVLYVGGGVLSLTKYHPPCATPFIGGLIPLLTSTDADDVSRAAELFVDSCTAPEKLLPYPQRLQWLGAFVSQPRTVRCLSITRVQPYEIWEQQARKLPVLIVQGTADQHCVYDNMIRFSKEIYEEVEVRMLEGVGHSPAVESPTETNRYIREWTNQVVARQENAQAKANSHPSMSQTRSESTSIAPAPKLRIAISGGGIAGLTLAATLCKYALNCSELEIDIYEADPEVRTAGAGITIWPRTWTVMRHLGLYDAMSKLAVKGEEVNQGERKPAFVARKADQPEEGFNFCYVLAPSGSTTMHRRDMIDVLLGNLPPSCKLHTSKRLMGYSQLDVTDPELVGNQPDAPLQLSFADDSTARADILIGADGIHSATRYAMYADAHATECLRESVPSGRPEGSKQWRDCERCEAALPIWSGVHSYRFLIPTEELYTLNPNHTTRSIGSVLSYSGKYQQVITYQISGGKYLNFVAVCREPNGDGAPYDGKWVAEAPREELLSRFTHWEPEVQQMLQVSDLYSPNMTLSLGGWVC
ncbi:hypothetical protein ONZ51_g8729 [Trametes cubensis]|uniref:Uncharacterized protein n=1 Tax=Trametes cubensis TaxID=1111947 RepID=A0AAD7TQ93_9APHY|nr:hypothetical protein ONZ51_g8729 [Trametes cubensis]